MEEKLVEIFNHFGYEKQRLKLAEEYQELQDEIFYIYDFGSDRDNLLSEVADVIILVLQFAFEYGYSKEDIEKMIKHKIDRTIDRIEEGYYENERDKNNI